MDIEGTEWITLRDAEEIIGRSRRQIWRYIYDGSWDTRAVIDSMNRQVTYIRLADILKKKTEIESVSNFNPVPATEKEAASAEVEGGESDLTVVRQLLERLIASQECQNNLIKRYLYAFEGINFTSLKIFMFIILIGIIVVAVCSIVNIIID